MGVDTKIEWADHTFNPWTGCTKVSPGCDHCYAEAWAKRSGHVQWGAWAQRRRTSEANWRLPAKWNAEAAATGRRARVFCASLADVFDNVVPRHWRAALFALIADTPHLDWLLLTKRIGNVAAMIEAPGMQKCGLPPNVWLGASIVNQEEADRDISKLLATPAAKRFLSMEPLLGPVDLRALRVGDRLTLDALTGCHSSSAGPGTLEECLASLPRLPGILSPVDWVIVGGESGPKARPMHPQWARSLRDQCTAASVQFLFKQWGEWSPDDWGEEITVRDTAGVLPSGDVALYSAGYVAPFDDGDRLARAGNVRLDGRTLMDKVGKKAAGRLLDGRTWDEVPTQGALI